MTINGILERFLPGEKIEANRNLLNLTIGNGGDSDDTGTNVGITTSLCERFIAIETANECGTMPLPDVSREAAWNAAKAWTVENGNAVTLTKKTVFSLYRSPSTQPGAYATLLADAIVLGRTNPVGR